MASPPTTYPNLHQFNQNTKDNVLYLNLTGSNVMVDDPKLEEYALNFYKLINDDDNNGVEQLQAV
ncbi:hypothetical protein HDV05_006020, partial [Chytridiales sp. JEL 0842]